jgi:hypothetical protein
MGKRHRKAKNISMPWMWARFWKFSDSPSCPPIVVLVEAIAREAVPLNQYDTIKQRSLDGRDLPKSRQSARVDAIEFMFILFGEEGIWNGDKSQVQSHVDVLF